VIEHLQPIGLVHNEQVAVCIRGEVHRLGELASFLSRGAAKKKRTKVTYICCSAKTKVVTYSSLFLFLFHKKCGFFFVLFLFFLPRLFGSIFLIAFLGVL
jgi:hypothetical protein